MSLVIFAKSWSAKKTVSKVESAGNIDQIRKEFDKTIDEMTEETEQEITELKQKFTSEIQKRDNLIDQIEDELADREEDLDMLEEDMKQKNVLIDQHRKKTESLAEELEERAREMELVIERLNTSEQESKTKEERSKREISQHEAEIASLRQAAQDQRQIHALKTEALMKELQETKKSLQVANARCDELTKSVATKDEELVSCRDRIWQLETAVSEQQEILEHQKVGFDAIDSEPINEHSPPPPEEAESPPPPEEVRAVPTANGSNECKYWSYAHETFIR
jgi:chromosome segregation ATPase